MAARWRGVYCCLPVCFSPSMAFHSAVTWLGLLPAPSSHCSLTATRASLSWAAFQLSPSSYLSLLFIHLLVTPTGTQALREFHLWGSKKRTRRVHFFKCCEAGQLRANRCLGSAANQKLRAPFLNSPCANCVLSCVHQLLHDVFLVNLVSISSLETKTISNTQWRSPKASSAGGRPGCWPFASSFAIEQFPFLPSSNKVLQTASSWPEHTVRTTFTSWLKSRKRARSISNRASSSTFIQVRAFSSKVPSLQRYSLFPVSFRDSHEVLK